VDWIEAKWAIIRGTLVGFFLGLLPGGGPVLASFMAYGIEKRVSNKPDRFGKGAIEGVASPESANNSASSFCAHPSLDARNPAHGCLSSALWGIPHPRCHSRSFALAATPRSVLGTHQQHVYRKRHAFDFKPALIPIWVQVLRIPVKFLYPLILLFCLIGAYSLNNDVFDIVVYACLRVVGYLCRKFDI